MPAAEIAGVMNLYTWPFDGGGQVTLLPGRRYFFTTGFGEGSSTSESYYFLSSYGAVATQDNTWGGTNGCVPIQSAAGGGLERGQLDGPRALSLAIPL